MSEVSDELNSYSNIKRISDEELTQVWHEYLNDRSNKKLRDVLIVQYIYLTKYIVNRIKSALPPDYSVEDVAGFGIEGLIDAVEKYTPIKNARFETYAMTRIRGNIIDKIRTADFLPRNLRQKIKEVKNTAESLRQELGRMPTSSEIGNELGLSTERVNELLAEDMPITSLYDKKSSADGSIEIIETIIDENEKLPLDILEEKDSKRELEQALNRLPEREKTVLVLYYHENMTLKEIGDAVEISESRACQLHSQALMRLKKILSGKRAERLKKSII